MLGAVLPVFVTNDRLLQLTYRTVETIQSYESVYLVVYVNRLVEVDIETFGETIGERFKAQHHNLGLPRRLLVVDGPERCVAGTWNEGMRLLLGTYSDERDPLEFIVFLNNDIELEEGTLDTLVSAGRGFPRLHPTIDLWSATNTRDHRPSTQYTGIEEGADFSCFMLRPDFPDIHGWFDENFMPCYYEDNDAFARITLAGRRTAIVMAAGYYHHGSMTIRLDNHAAQTNARTFDLNRQYFQRKWGVPQPLNSRAEILRQYYTRPFNDLSLPLHWWPEPTRKDFL